MAITVTLDTYADTNLDTPITDTLRPKRFVRTGFVEGIDVSAGSGNKYEAMFLAQNAVIIAEAANPLTLYPELKLRYILFDAATDTQANVRLIYETIIFGQGIPPSTYVLTDGGQTVMRETNYIVDADGKRYPIKIGWDASDAPFAPSIPEDYAKASFGFPHRTLQLDALIYGRPTNGQGFLRHANDGTWPTTPPTLPGIPDQGPTPLPRGYWRLDQYLTRTFKTAGYYTLTATTTSRVIEDWSDLIIQFDHRTGRYVQVGTAPVTGDPAGDAAAAAANGQAIIDALFSTQYDFGIVLGVDPAMSTRRTGCARVGPYPVTSFSDIFGF